MTIHPLRSNLFRLFVAVPLIALGALTASTAQAAPVLTVTKDLPQSLGGSMPYYYSTVTIQDGATLSVLPLTGNGGTGRLHIIANVIIIQSGGVLDAVGVGHRGVSGMPGGGKGGGGYAANYSGGGGGYFGIGGAGVNPACATGIFGTGGMAYGVIPPPFDVGSAGGSGGKSPGPIGGSGGGSITLEAADIQIYGTINVSGDPGSSINGVGSGGGAGGEIRLQASKFTWGVKAQLIAVGGTGGNAANESGGSGGGGLIWLRGAPEPPVEVKLDVSGGASTITCPAGAGAGAAGQVVKDSTTFACRDLDGDGVTSSLCGGTDCDDADPTVNPMAKDECDGVDNDCNKAIDDAMDACATGSKCETGICKPIMIADGGMNTDGGDAAAPEVLEYRGGCSVPTAPSNAAPLAAIGVLVAFGAHVARRGRSKSR